MKVPTLYLDTSVIGGYFDPEFEDATRELWKQKDQGRYCFYTSPTFLREITEAPEVVRNLFTATFHDSKFFLDVNDEAAALAQAYLQQKAVPPRYADDAVHVAVAVVHRIDFVVSWNFRHLVNVQRNDVFNAVNLLQGYPSVRIVNPLELIYGSEEKN